MAIKSADQISIVDLTDGYSVILTSDGYTFPGTTTAAKAGSCTTQVIAMCGSEQVSASVDLTAITAPTGITVTKNTDTTAPTLTITASTSFTSAGLVTIPVTVDGEITIIKQFSVGIALTGATGGTGAAATNVILGMDSATVACTKDRAATAASTITIPFAGYQGTSRKACSCTVGTLPSGVTSSSNTAATTSADGSLVLAIASGANFGGTAASYDNVSITLTFSCNGITFTKMFTLSKSITGATGSTGAGANNVIIGNESVTIPCTKDGMVKSAMEITIPFAGYQGTSRRACTLTDPTLPSGMTKKSNTAATTSADGSFVITVAANGTLGAAATLNGEITLSFSCNGQTFVKKLSWAKSLTGATGATGAAGADAISIAITSSNGTIFKNSSIETNATFANGTNYENFGNLRGTDGEYLAILSKRDNPRLSFVVERTPNDESESVKTSIRLTSDVSASVFTGHGYTAKLYRSSAHSPATASDTVTTLNATIAQMLTGITDSTSAITTTFSNGSDWSFLLVVSNGYETRSATANIPRAFANVHMSGCRTGGVAFGKFSGATENNPLFECAYPIVLNGSAVYGSSSAMPANPVEGQLYFVVE